MYYRKNTCDQIDESMVGESTTLCGFVQNIRDHGGIKFFDLRDHYGVVQLNLQKISASDSVSRESVIQVSGKIIARDSSSYNLKLKSGKVELLVEDMKILSKASVLPFEISECDNVSEDVRLKYRYLELRGPKWQNMLKFRNDLLFDIRKIMQAKNFLEVQTPILSASSPEGARDYLVPSRVHKGMFYALPQAPQQFKQLLMCSNVDKYFQIAPCFRDEDGRADRTPGEFYQLDIEMSYCDKEEVFSLIEDVMGQIFEKFKKVSLPKHFERISYKDAMTFYGTDKPDLRNPIKFVDLTKTFENTEFKAFKGNRVKGFSINTSKIARSFYDNLTNYMLSVGAKGLAWVRVLDDGTLKGPIMKFISLEEAEQLKKLTNADVGDDIFVIADEPVMCDKLSNLLRTRVAKDLNLIDYNDFKLCWIVDFPFFELNEETNKLDFGHNPFSKIRGGIEALNSQNPLDIIAEQYDLVINGYEAASGAERNTSVECLYKAFEMVGYSKELVDKNFKALITAFKYGVPPHCGIAPGLERLMMILTNSSNIRDVIPFPMSVKAQDLLMGAPSVVTEQQLREVHIKLR